MDDTTATLRSHVDEVPYWYHTLELAPGVVTPGHFDLRGVVDEFPWPDVRGKRCLDVATFDGFFAFELERRGAAEVVAIDLDDAADLDWLPRRVPAGFARGDEPIGTGFRVAHDALGSSVERVVRSVYDLDPDELGTFDVVVCGALLQHLRDPAGALLAMRRMCTGDFLSVELVDPWRSLLFPRTPLVHLMGHARSWGLGNVAAHRHLLHVAGFDLEESSRVGVPFGPGFTVEQPTGRQRLRRATRGVAWRLLTGTEHPPFQALRGRPSTSLHAIG